MALRDVVCCSKQAHEGCHIPRVQAEDASRIMRVLLALRGYDKRKQLQAWEAGTLALKPSDISMQSTAQRWYKAIGATSRATRLGKGGAIAVDAGDTGSLAHVPRHPPIEQQSNLTLQDKECEPTAAIHMHMNLKDVFCPVCNSTFPVGGTRLCTKAGFSSLKCKNKECRHVEPSQAWRCRCRLLWIKCPRHVLQATGHNAKSRPKEPTLKARRIAAYGLVDRPMPVERTTRKLNQSKGLYSHRRAAWRTSMDETSSDDYAGGEAVANTGNNYEHFVVTGSLAHGGGGAPHSKRYHH